MKNTLKIILSLFLMCVVIGVEEDRLKSVSVMEGDSVTLNIDSTKIQGIILIQWRFGGSGAVIAETVKNEISYLYHTDIFKGRLQVDHQTGSLTIKNMRSKHSGLYKLQINHSTGSSYMAFNVTVYDSPPVIDFEMKSVMEGDSLTLPTDVTEPHGDELIVWRFGDDGKLIAKYDIETNSAKLYDDADEIFRDRLQLNDHTGSLTITNTRATDSGLYTVKISSSSKETLYKRFNVTASENKVTEAETLEMLPSNKDVDGVNGQKTS
ncbi:CD48 antigen-like isoform X2 [Chanodichthys erythropterus]|uniref:CD48 antigen-like isoform X2 n=1 Tax=Chanodichthys erythropterus TaxID=933992 RepID=UPI00351E9E24